MNRVRFFLTLASIYVLLTAPSFAQQRPPWEQFDMPICDSHGACFAEMQSGELGFFLGDEQGQVLFVLPIKEYFFRLNPEHTKASVEVADADAEFWYCDQGAEACLDNFPDLWSYGTGHMNQNATYLWDSQNGWVTICPSVWFNHGTVRDQTGTAFDLTSTLLLLPSQNESCRLVKLSIEISPSK